MGDTIYGDKYGGDHVRGDKYVNLGGRGGGAPEGSGRRRRAEPRTVLLMSANPGGTAPVRLDEERRAIDRAVTLARATDRLSIHIADAVRLDDLQSALLRYRPAVAHFSGHGAATPGVVVCDDTGRPRLVPPDALSDLFRVLGHPVRCVVLNACFTDGQARAIAEHVPCVVGMRGRVLDDTAILFAAGFYEGIASAESIQVSFDLGRNRARLHGQPDDRAPILLTNGRGADHRILVPR